jgi:hypothetical protein
LFLGRLKPGESVTKKLVVRGKQPFKITGIDCDDPCFNFDTSGETDEPKTRHLIPVTFTAGDKPGEITHEVAIRTDMGQNSASKVVCHASVIAESTGS